MHFIKSNMAEELHKGKRWLNLKCPIIKSCFLITFSFKKGSNRKWGWMPLFGNVIQIWLCLFSAESLLEQFLLDSFISDRLPLGMCSFSPASMCSSVSPYHEVMRMERRLRSSSEGAGGPRIHGNQRDAPGMEGCGLLKHRNNSSSSKLGSLVGFELCVGFYTLVQSPESIPWIHSVCMQRLPFKMLRSHTHTV